MNAFPISILNYFPGQKVTVFLETVDVEGVRTDVSTLPLVNRVIFPELTLASNYPQYMIQLDIGLYYYQFVLPTGAQAVGNYLVDVSFVNSINGAVNTKIYQIIVAAPYGNFSILT